MTVHIFDDDAFDKLAALEGAPWAKVQEMHRESPYGFYAWLDAWQAKQVTPDSTDEPVTSFIEGGDGMLYGEGGYARFVLSLTGELLLLGWSTRAEKCQLAQSLGFSVR